MSNLEQRRPQVIQLTRRGMVVSGSPADLDLLRHEFERQHYVRLPALLESELLQFIYGQIDSACFLPEVHQRIGVELAMTENPLLAMLLLLANDSEFFEVIQIISGCAPIGSFSGRVYRVIPDQGHYDSWHDDVGNHRMVAMSINLSREIYSGGVLQIRERKSQRIVQEVANLGFGDGIVFHLAYPLQHRITDVTGTIPKTAFAGWFRSEPKFLSLVKGGSEPASCHPERM